MIRANRFALIDPRESPVPLSRQQWYQGMHFSPIRSTHPTETAITQTFSPPPPPGECILDNRRNLAKTVTQPALCGRRQALIFFSLLKNVSWDFFAFVPFKESFAFLYVFPSLPRIVGVRPEQKIFVLSVILLALFQESLEEKIRRAILSLFC